MRQRSVKSGVACRGFGYFISQCKCKGSSTKLCRSQVQTPAGGSGSSRRGGKPVELLEKVFWGLLWTNHASLRKSLLVKVLKATKVLGGSADALVLFLLFSSPVLTGCVGDRALG